MTSGCSSSRRLISSASCKPARKRVRYQPVLTGDRKGETSEDTLRRDIRSSSNRHQCPIQNMLGVRRVRDLGGLNKLDESSRAAVREDVRVSDEIQDNLRVSDDAAPIFWRRAASRKWGRGLTDD
jgi:hypothetical protein